MVKIVTNMKKILFITTVLAFLTSVSFAQQKKMKHHRHHRHHHHMQHHGMAAKPKGKM